MSINKSENLLNNSYNEKLKKSVPLDGDFTFDDILEQRDGS